MNCSEFLQAKVAWYAREGTYFVNLPPIAYMCVLNIGFQTQVSDLNLSANFASNGSMITNYDHKIQFFMTFFLKQKICKNFSSVSTKA